MEGKKWYTKRLYETSYQISIKREVGIIISLMRPPQNQWLVSNQTDYKVYCDKSNK